MSRANLPLKPAAGMQPPQGQAPAATLIPPLADGKLGADGPLGPRPISPQLLAQLQQARERQSQGLLGSTGFQMGGLPASPLPPEAVEKVPAVPVVREQPSPVDYPVEPPKAAAEMPRAPGAPPGVPVNPKADEAGGLLESVALTGMEFKANPMLAADSEFISDVIWMADPRRRKIIDARAEPIDWSGFTTGMDITQRVLMWTTPFDLCVTFRKVKADDEFLARRIITDLYSRNDAEGEIGLLVTTAAASVVSVGGRKMPALPSPMDKPDLETRLEIMRERVRLAGTFDMTLLRDLVINYAWFVRRATLDVRRGDRGGLGNG